MQLMQQNVQKSRSTTFPRRSFSEISPAAFNQPFPPSRSGALILLGKGFSGASPFLASAAFSFSSAAVESSPGLRLSLEVDLVVSEGLASGVFFGLSAGGAAIT